MPRTLLINTLDENWHDRDTLLLHAGFQCLADCVEQERRLDGHLNWSHDECTQAAHHELTALYQWWQIRTGTLAAESGPFEMSQYEEDNTMLIRLINVRGYLWT